MTSQEQNEWLAVEVMGWHLDRGHVTPNRYYDEEHIEKFLDWLWNPLENIEQAMMVAKQLGVKHSLWLTLHQVSSKPAEWHAYFTFGGMAVGNRIRGGAYASKDEPARAICLAAIKAKRGE